LEATGRYDGVLRFALAEAGIPSSRVNPDHPRGLAKALGRKAKSDSLDARLLAEFGQRLRPDPAPPPCAEEERLKQLHRRRDQLVLARAKEKTQAKDALCKEVRDSHRRAIDRLTAEIVRFERLIGEAVSKNRRLAERARLLKTAPGIGEVAATTLIALMPELGTLTPKTSACLAGLAPFDRDSGQLRGGRRIEGGRRRVRQALYMAALVAATRTKSRFRKDYLALIERGKPKKLALIAIARKLLVTLNAMLRDDHDYAPA
jgi:transposase